MLRDGSTVHVRPARPTTRGAARQFLERAVARARCSCASSPAASTSRRPRDWASRRRLRAAATGWSRRPARDGRIVGHAGFERSRPARPRRGGLRRRRRLCRATGSARSCSPTSPRRRRSRASSCSRPRCCPTTTDGRGVPRERLRRPDPLEARTSSWSSSRPRCPTRRSSASTSATAPPPPRRCGHFLAPALGGGDRCLARARHGRRRDLPQPARGRVQRPGLPGQPAAPTSSSRCPPSSRSGTSPATVDLAVWRCRPPAVVEVARECAAKGVRALVVISAGFAETGEEGARAPARAARRSAATPACG